MNTRFFILSLIVIGLLSLFGNMLIPLFGVVLVADKVRKCPCCNQPINRKDYGKEMWEGATK